MMIACIRMRNQLPGLLQMCDHKMLLQACNGKRAEPATVVRAAPPPKYRHVKWNLWFLADCVLHAVKQSLLDALARQCVCCAQQPLHAAAPSYI
eukprot:12936-Heterococcus_DN1.PRE.2